MCVREKKAASNTSVREKNPGENERSSEKVNERTRHIGNRKQYNGKSLGASYTGGKRNSSASFMFHNFLNDWGMGNLWMLFKKYGTVFDMFMVQKRLRNGQRYGNFVRFKNIVSVENLLKRLRDIRVGSELLRVYLAYDRRGNEGERGYRVKTSEEGSRVNRFNHKMHHDDVTKQGNGGADKRFDIRDTRRYNDVVRGKPSDGKEYRGDDNAKDDKCRMLTMGEEDIGMDIFKRSIIGEVKKSSYLVRLPELCGAMGISKVEVKALGGLKVMLAFETVRTAENILRDVEHGLRRWLHKIRRCTDTYKPVGRLTWINIIGVPVTCWKESVFRRIAEWHGLVIETNNCSLVGNQNLMIGREKRDVVEHCLQENINTKKNEEQEDGHTNMDEDRNDEGNMKERNRKTDGNGNESGDDEDNGEDEMADEKNLDEGSKGGDGSAFRKAAHGGREPHEDQESRVSSEVKVKYTFEEENTNYQKKAALGNTSDECSKKRDEMEGPGIVNVNIVNDGPMVDEANEGVATNTRPVMDKNVVVIIGEQNTDGLINGLTSQNNKSDTPFSNEINEKDYPRVAAGH
ncbi:transposon TX1 [Tanacetum coccineum]